MTEKLDAVLAFLEPLVDCFSLRFAKVGVWEIEPIFGLHQSGETIRSSAHDFGVLRSLGDA